MERICTPVISCEKQNIFQSRIGTAPSAAEHSSGNKFHPTQLYHIRTRASSKDAILNLPSCGQILNKAPMSQMKLNITLLDFQECFALKPLNVLTLAWLVNSVFCYLNSVFLSSQGEGRASNHIAEQTNNRKDERLKLYITKRKAIHISSENANRLCRWCRGVITWLNSNFVFH